MNDSQHRPIDSRRIADDSQSSPASSEVDVDPLYTSRRDVMLVYVAKILEDHKFEANYGVFRRETVGLFKDLIRSLRLDGGTLNQLSIANAMDSVRCRLLNLLEILLGSKIAQSFQVGYTEAARKDQRVAFSRPETKIACRSHILSVSPDLLGHTESSRCSTTSFSLYSNFRESLALEDHSLQGRFQPEYQSDQHIYDVLWTLMCHGFELCQNPRVYDELWRPLAFSSTIREVQGSKLFVLLDRPKCITFGGHFYGSIYRSGQSSSGFVLKRPLGTLLQVQDTPENVLAFYGAASISGPISYILQRVLDDDSDNWAVESEYMSSLIPGDPRQHKPPVLGARRPLSPRSSPLSVSTSSSPSSSIPSASASPGALAHRLGLWRAQRTLARSLGRETGASSKVGIPRPPPLIRTRHEPFRATCSPKQGGNHLGQAHQGEHDATKENKLEPGINGSLISASRPSMSPRNQAALANDQNMSAQGQVSLRAEAHCSVGMSSSLPSNSPARQASNSPDGQSPVQGSSTTSSFGSIINCYSRASSSGSGSPYVLSSTAMHTEVTKSDGGGTTVINNIQQKFYIHRGDTFFGAINGGFVGGRKNLNTVSEVLNA